MAWPQWGAAPQIPSLLAGVNSAPPVATPMQQPAMPAGYTPEQYQQLQQQNWQQWAQWQQQYQQWHQQYGEQYQKLAATGAIPPVANVMGGAASAPPVPSGPPLPPPNEPKPPPPPPPDDMTQVPPGGQQYSAPPPQQQRPNHPWQNTNANKRPYNQTPEWEGNKRQMVSQGQWNNQNQGRGPGPSKPPEKPVSSVNHVKKLEELSEAEKKFDKEFAAWEAQFNRWKEQNANHPDKTQYREYEKKWESWRNSLLERREQMRKKRLALQAAKEAAKGPGHAPLSQGTKPLPLLGNHPQGNALPHGSRPPPLLGNHPPLMPERHAHAPPQINAPQSLISQRGGNPPPLIENPVPISEKPLEILNKPPPTQNNEPLTFKPPQKYPGEEVMEVSEDGDGFLKTSEGYDGIPGLDLDKADEAPKNSEETDENAVKASGNTGQNLDAISKGINTILGDPKLLNMLSMVSQNQNFASSVLTNTAPRIQERPPVASSGGGPPSLLNMPVGAPPPYEYSNQSYNDEYDDNNRALREDVHNFDDQTRMSFNNGPNDQDVGYGNAGNFSRPPPRSGFGRRPPNSNFGRFDGPGTDSFDGRPPNSDSFGGRPQNNDSFGGRPPNNDSFGGRPPNNDSFSGRPPNNDTFGGRPPNNDTFGGRPPNNDAFGGRPPNNDTFGGRPPNNDTFGGRPPNNDTFGGRPPNNDTFGGRPPNNDTFGGRPPNNDTFGGRPPINDSFSGRPPNNDSFGGRPPNNEFDRFENGNFGRGIGYDNDRFGKRPGNNQFDRGGKRNDNFGRGGGNFGRGGNNFSRGARSFDEGYDDDNYVGEEESFNRGDMNFGRGRGRGDGKFGRGGRSGRGDRFERNDQRNSGRDFNNKDQFQKGKFNDDYDDYDDQRYDNQRYEEEWNEDEDYDHFHDRFNEGEERHHDPRRQFGQPPHFDQQQQLPHQDQPPVEAPPGHAGPNPPTAIPSLFQMPFREPPVEPVEPVQQIVEEVPALPAPVVEEELFVPEVVVDYEHKPLKPPEPEISLEPIYTFDYRNKPVSRIPYPQRPKWLYETVRNIRQFDPLGTTRFGFEPPPVERPRYDQRPPFMDQRVPPYERPPIPRGPDVGRYPPEREHFERRPGMERNERRRSFERDLERGRSRERYERRETEKYDERKRPRDKDYDRDRRFDRNDGRLREKDHKSPNRDNRRSKRDVALRKEDLEELSDGDFEDDNKQQSKSPGGGIKFSPTPSQLNRISPDLALGSNPSNPGAKSNEPTMIEDLLYPPGRYKRPPRIVIILRGPPGSGKTFLAKLIKDKEVENGGSAPRILSLDDYFMVEHEKQIIEDGMMVKVKQMSYEYEAEMEDSYRESLIKAFKKTITDGYFPFIIVDNVNEKVRYFGEMWSFAKQNGFQVYICQMDLDPDQCIRRNIHNRTKKEIEDYVASWEPTPSHHPIIDANSFLQNAIPITEVEMEVVEPNREGAKEDESAMEDEAGSKWDTFDCSENNLARLDGVNKPLKPSRTMEEYLQLEDEWQEPTEPLKPGKKRVRWADLEEQRQQKKMRALGFVVGQTDWNRMTDQSEGQNALTQTKYIERVRRK